MPITCPSAKALVSTFHILSGQANLIRRLCKEADNPEVLEQLIDQYVPETRRYVQQMHSSPYRSGMWRRTVVLHAISHIIEGYGVEALGRGSGPSFAPPYEYINMGDPYVTTLIYKKSSDRLSIGDWGSLVERHPRLGE